MNYAEILFNSFGFYLTENTLCLHHKGQSINSILEEVAVYCETHTGQLNTMCGKNAGISNFKAGGAYSYRCYFDG